MKKIALFVTAIAVSLSLGGRVLADTNTTTFVIAPNKSMFYIKKIRK